MFSFLILLIIISIITGIFFYVNNSETHISPNSKDYVLVSFKIDDINFARNQKQELENALILARKYNITFDLGVIAQSFKDYADPETFKIYQDNQDVFEVVAHGLTHNLDSEISNYGGYGEFGIVADWNFSVPAEIQEEHIKKMKEIFDEKNLTMADKIFVVPYHTGDENTIKLAGKYGYKLIVQQLTIPKSYSEQNYGEITATQNFIDIPMKQLLSAEDLKNYSTELNKAINLNQSKIEISFHPINFDVLITTDYFFKQLLNQSSSKIKFGMISERFHEIK